MADTTTPVADPMRVPVLDTLVSLGRHLEFYDPDGVRHGLPTYPYRWAPTHLATRRQLRAAQLRPGGQPIAAQILWLHKGRIRVAYLYDIAATKPKRVATPAQLVAIRKALRARCTCTTCGAIKPYFIPRSLGECLDCAPGGAA
jgi:hypothetical protein